jgi:hypothetical protein
LLGDDATRVVEGEDRRGRDHLAVTELRSDPVLVANRPELEIVGQGVAKHSSSLRRSKNRIHMQYFVTPEIAD